MFCFKQVRCIKVAVSEAKFRQYVLLVAEELGTLVGING